MTRVDHGKDDTTRGHDSSKGPKGPNEDTIHYREPGEFPADERPAKAGLQDSFDQNGPRTRRADDEEGVGAHGDSATTKTERDRGGRFTEEGAEDHAR